MRGGGMCYGEVCEMGGMRDEEGHVRRGGM